MTNDEIKQKLFEITTGLNKVNDEFFKRKELNAYMHLLNAVDEINKAFEEIIDREEKGNKEK